MRAILLFLIIGFPALGAEAPDFPQVAAIFSERCLACHSSAVQQGGLLLDSYESLMRGGRYGPVVVPGRSGESRLIVLLEGRLQPRMPLEGKPVAPQQIALIKAWIDAGAKPAATGASVEAAPSLRPIPTTAEVAPQIASLAFSPDGRLLAVGTYKEVELREAATGRRLARLDGHADVVRAVAFSPDGRLLAAAGGAPARFGEVKLWDVADRRLLREWRGHADCIYAATFRKDGGMLATGSYDKLIKLWDVATGQEIRTLKDHIDAVLTLAFSPNGRRLASGAADRAVKIWDPDTGQRLFTLSDPNDGVQALAFHPSGRQLAAAGADKTVRIWNLEDGAGALAQSLIAHEDTILQIVYSPDGRLLLTTGADRLIKVWDAATLQELHVFPRQPDWVLALAFSPDGRRLAAGRFDGTLSLYDSATWEQTFLAALGPATLQEKKP